MAAAGLTLGLSLLGTATHAQINMQGTLTPPTVGYYDQSYLPGVVVEGEDTIDSPFNATTQGSGYNDADTYVSNPDRASKAQSFTTGPNPAGYILNSFTFQQADGGPNGTWGGERHLFPPQQRRQCLGPLWKAARRAAEHHLHLAPGDQRHLQRNDLQPGVNDFRLGRLFEL